LPALLQDLSRQQQIALQIVVADGGSSDDTVAIARSAGVDVVASARGRGVQMNAGSRRASSDFLLFLHADSALPDPLLLAEALTTLREAIARRGDANVAGHFPLRFADASPQHATFYRYVEGKTRLNRPFTINGDQGLLIARSFFDQLGGFDEGLAFLEDQRIAAQIFARGQWLLLPGSIVTSARRFETEGIAERYALMAVIMGLYAGGADDFFRAAPQIYRAPTGRLDLRSQLEAIERYLRGLGFAPRWRLLLKIGGFVRDNAWQLAYRRDVLAQDDARSRLRRFDRWIAPMLRNPVATIAGAVLARGWFLRLLRRENPAA
jgi:rSAM/selenodomain-associated transferase 2